MKLFKKKVIEKESNVAVSPEPTQPYIKFSVAKFYLLLWNILSMMIYIVNVLYIILLIVDQIEFLRNIIIYLLAVYALAFVLIVILSIGSKSKLKLRMKNYKSAVKFLQYFIQIISFVISFVTALSTFLTKGYFDSKALFNALTSLIITCVMVFFEVIKILIRKNIPIVKENFLRLREEDDFLKLDKFKKFKKNRNNKNEAIAQPTESEISENEPAESDVDENQHNNSHTPAIDYFSKTHEEDNLDYRIVPVEKQKSKLKNTILEEEPVLSENEEYDRHAGVVIYYDEDEENEEDESNCISDIDEYDNLHSRKKSKGLFKRFFKK